MARSLHRALFSRFATPDELLESALVRLKKDEHSRKGCDRSFLASRKKTLDKLRLVIQLKPDRMKAYTVLATELLYEDINNSAAGPGESGYNNEEGKRKTNNNSSLGRRKVQTIEKSQKESNNLLECGIVIKQGLSVDPENASLQKLQTEWQIITQYGRNGSQSKMMNIGSVGWMRG